MCAIIIDVFRMCDVLRIALFPAKLARASSR